MACEPCGCQFRLWIVETKKSQNFLYEFFEDLWWVLRCRLGSDGAGGRLCDDDDGWRGLRSLLSDLINIFTWSTRFSLNKR